MLFKDFIVFEFLRNGTKNVFLKLLTKLLLLKLNNVLNTLYLIRARMIKKKKKKVHLNFQTRPSKYLL
jgi:hypothetical protein